MQGVLGWDDILCKEYWGGMTYCARSTGVGWHIVQGVLGWVGWGGMKCTPIRYISYTSSVRIEAPETMYLRDPLGGVTVLTQ